MKKKYHSAIKFLAGTLAAVVVGCMVSVSMIKPENVRAEEVGTSTPASDPAPTPTASINVSSLSLPLDGSFKLSATLTQGASTVQTGWIWKSSDKTVADVESDGTVRATYKAEAVSQGAITMITATAVNGGYSASCRVTVMPSLSSPVAVPNTPSVPSTPTTPTQPATDPTEPGTPGNTTTEPTEPAEPTEPTEPTEPGTPSTPVAPDPGPDIAPIAPNPSPVETVPPANTVITGVTVNDDGTVTDAKGVLVQNAIVDENGTKYITNGSGEKIVNQIVTTQDGTMYGTLADGRVAWSATFTLGGKKYFAAADGVIAVKKFSTTPYDHKVYSRADGTLVQNKLFKVNGKRYYARKSGAVVQGKWVKVGNKKYYCNSKGVITKSKNA